MNKTYLFAIYSIIALIVGLSAYYVYLRYPFPRLNAVKKQEQKTLDWPIPRAKNVVLSKCKQIVLPTEEDKTQYISMIRLNANFKSEVQIVSLVSMTDSESDTIKILRDPNSQKCWVVFAGDLNGNGEILFETNEDKIEKYQVNNFSISQ